MGFCDQESAETPSNPSGNTNFETSIRLQGERKLQEMHAIWGGGRARIESRTSSKNLNPHRKKPIATPNRDIPSAIVLYAERNPKKASSLRKTFGDQDWDRVLVEYVELLDGEGTVLPLLLLHHRRHSSRRLLSRAVLPPRPRRLQLLRFTPWSCVLTIILVVLLSQLMELSATTLATVLFTLCLSLTAMPSVSMLGAPQ